MTPGSDGHMGQNICGAARQDCRHILLQFSATVESVPYPHQITILTNHMQFMLSLVRMWQSTYGPVQKGYCHPVADRSDNSTEACPGIIRQAYWHTQQQQTTVNVVLLSMPGVQVNRSSTQAHAAVCHQQHTPVCVASRVMRSVLTKHCPTGYTLKIQYGCMYVCMYVCMHACI